MSQARWGSLASCGRLAIGQSYRRYYDSRLAARWIVCSPRYLFHTGNQAMKKTGGKNAPILSDPLAAFHAPVREWFEAVFPGPTRPQELGWPPISRGDTTLILAPTGTGKTLSAFLWCIDRLMFEEPPPAAQRCRVLYISPIKALAVDVERNLRAPLAGVAQIARKRNVEFHEPSIAIRTGDTPAAERSRFSRRPADILITTPESIYLMLTSNARGNPCAPWRR